VSLAIVRHAHGRVPELATPVGVREGGRFIDDRREAHMRHRSPLRRLAVVPIAALALAACGGDGDDEADDQPAVEEVGDGATTDDAADDGATSDGDPEGAPAGTDEPPATDAPSGGGDSGSAGGAAGTGFIQIGDVRHDLTVGRCINLFGAIGGDAASVTEPDNVEVSFDFSPDDWQERPASEGWEENGSVTLRSEEPYLQWETGPSLIELFNLPAGLDPAAIDITSFDIDDSGRSVQGEAIFIEVTALLTGAEVVPTPGTFAFSCPEE
jgi:hypothetical protein